MAFTLTDGTNTVSFFPDYKSYKATAFKSENKVRTPEGRLYKANHGTVLKWNAQLTYINSADMYNLNNWWETDTFLSFTPDLTSDVTTVSIVNKGKPVEVPIKPYNDLFKAMLMLEEVKAYD